MFNPEQKRSFISSYSESCSTVKACESLFQSTEHVENDIGHDICEMTEEEAFNLLEDSAGMRTVRKNVRCLILKEYAKWCISNNVPNANRNILNIVPTGVQKIKRTMVSNPTHLQMYLNSIYTPEDMDGTDNIFRCYYWLAYMGVKESDILSVKISDVDFHDMMVLYRGEKLRMEPESFKCFRKSAELKQFAIIHPLYQKQSFKDRIPGDTLIRGVRGKIDVLYMRMSLSRQSQSKMTNEKEPLRMSYYGTWLSGLFYRMYQRETAGIEVDFKPFAIDHMEDKEYKLSSGRNTLDDKMKQIIRDFRADYCRWKMAFKI